MATRKSLTHQQEGWLYDDAKAFEQFYVRKEEPTFTAWGVDGLFRRVKWDYKFSSYILLWFFRWYAGDEKCDGTRTTMIWQAKYGQSGYVMTTTPKEKFSFRLRWRRPDRERWDNAGGI